MNIEVKYSGESSHIGDNNFTLLSNLEIAIEKIKNEWQSDDELIDILEDLAEYISNVSGRENIGLERKLENGSREDLISRAIFLKNKFSRRVAKNQMSRREQQVYIQILSAINTIWYHTIKPKIMVGTEKSEIDQMILYELIMPVHKAVVRFDATVTTETVGGMLYYLTGNCHINWE